MAEKRRLRTPATPAPDPVERVPLIRDELLPPRRPERRHLIAVSDLTRADVERLLALARNFARSLEREVK
jgi:hypothetical protein